MIYIRQALISNANQGQKISLTNQADSFAKVLKFGKAQTSTY
jgi:hypothetical protein